MTATRFKKIIFVTGTDTGVGKTLLTALLLQHLRANGSHALAMKPFCSGGRADVKFLQAMQPGEISDDEVNPFYFAEPVAPLVAQKRRRQKIALADVVEKIRHVQNQCEQLVIEGSGGLLVPLGADFSVADLVIRLKPKIIVAARNQLGAVNHTLLTLEALRSRGLQVDSVVLMEAGKADLSSQTNQKTLNSLTRIAIFCVPNLGANFVRNPPPKNTQKKLKKILAQILK